MISAQDEAAADTLAWVYWIYALCYTLTSLLVLLQAPVLRLVACVRSCVVARSNEVEDSSELDALVPRRDWQ